MTEPVVEPPKVDKTKGVTVLFNHLDGANGPRALRFNTAIQWAMENDRLSIQDKDGDLLAQFRVGTYAGVFYTDARAPDTGTSTK